MLRGAEATDEALFRPVVRGVPATAQHTADFLAGGSLELADGRSREPAYGLVVRGVPCCRLSRSGPLPTHSAANWPA